MQDARIRAVVQFGSRARGEADHQSDHDLLVFAEGDLSPLDIYEAVGQLVPTGDLDAHVYSPHMAPSLAFEILKDAQVVYESAPGQGLLDLAELATIAEPAPPALQDFLEVARMGREETLRRIERKLSILERRLAGLQARIGPVEEDQFLADEMLQEFAFARLYKITQDVIDIAALVLALEGRIPPAESAERLKSLGEINILSSTLAARLVAMARFRNVLAHIYDELDLTRLYRFSSKDIGDVQSFLQAIKAYLVSRLSTDQTNSEKVE